MRTKPDLFFREQQEVSSEYARLDEYRSFYQLSGDPILTLADFRRYQESQERIQKEIPAFIIQGLKHGDLSARLGMIEVLAQVPEDQQEEIKKKVIPIILEALQLEISEEQSEFLLYRALKLIPRIPAEQRACLIQQAFQHKDPGIRFYAAQYIKEIPAEDRVYLVHRALQDTYGPLFSFAAELIEIMPESERESLQTELSRRIKEIFQMEDSFFHYRAACLIDKVSREDQKELWDLALKDKNSEVRSMAKRLIDPDSEIITQKVDSNYDTRFNIQQRIRIASESKRSQLIEKALKDKNSSIRFLAIDLLDLVPILDRTELVERALEDEDLIVFHTAAIFIEKVLEKEQVRLKLKLFQRLKTELQSGSLDCFFILGMIELIDDTKQRVELIKSNPVLEQELKMLAKTTPLYTDVQDPFFHKRFLKTGSGTTLLDKVPGTKRSLRERIIIRHIDVGPYQEWERTYRDVEFWKKQGFEYVPVEPIVKAVLNPRTYRVDVATRILIGTFKVSFIQK